MKSGTIAGLLGAAILAGFSLNALAELKDNPYQVIIDRNPFNLRPIPPPPPPPTETNAPAEPPPEVKLTGITTLLGTPKVFLQLEDKKTKKPSFPPPMAVGDTEEGISIVSIDTENLKVRIKNGDAETTLDFKNHGVKAGAGAAVAGAIPQPGVMPGKVPAIPPPVIPAAAVPQPGAPNTGRAIVAGGTPSAAAAYNPAAGAYGGGVPARPLRTDNLSIPGGGNQILAGGGSQVYNPNPQPAVNPAPQYNRQEAEAIMELTRQKLQQQEQTGQMAPGQPHSALIPPTALGRALGTTPTPTPSPNPFPTPNVQR